MTIRTYKVTLDSKNTIAPEPVFLRQGDKTGAVVIDATLMDNGTPVSLSGLTPMFKANTADGQAVIADSTGFNIIDASGGKFTYQVPNALSALPGKITTAYFSFSDSSGSESTFDVAFIIKKAVDMTQPQADDYITVIDGTLLSLQQKIDAMNTDVQTIINNYNTGNFYNKSETDKLNSLKADQTNLDYTNLQLNSIGINILHPQAPLVGCKGDGVTDDTDNFNAIYEYAKNNKKILIVPETSQSYRLSKFNGKDNVDVYGAGKPRFDIFFKEGVSITPLLSFGNNSRYENIYFNSLVEDEEWNRGELTGREDITFKNCRLEGFRNPTKRNSWGLYLDKTKNVVIDTCEFENNTQSDIAIVNGCENITIINAKGSNLHLNFEPNTLNDPIKNINIIGGTFNKISILDVALTGNTIQGVSITGSTINLLYYKGGSVELTETIINKIAMPQDNYNGYNMGGILKLNDSVSLGQNLIEDYGIKDLKNAIGEYGWGVGQASAGGLVERVKKGNKNVIKFNGELKTAKVSIDSQRMPVKANKEYLLTLTSQSTTTASSKWVGSHILYSFFDALDNKLKSDYIYLNRSEAGVEQFMHKESAVIVAPENAVKLQLSLMNSKVLSPTAIEVEKISLQEINYTKANNVDIDDDDYKFISDSKPTQLFSGLNNVYFKGDICYNSNPVSGAYVGWICTTSGNPGSWNGFGIIE